MSQTGARQRLESWTAELDRELGWTTTVSDEGVCGFEAKDGLIVSVEAPGELDLLVFHAPVGDLADPDDVALLRALLTCNWYGLATGPGQLGLEPGGRRLVLALPWLGAAEADLEQFMSMLLRFTEIASRLRLRISQRTVLDLLASAPPGGTGESGEAGPPPFMVRG